MIIQKQKCHLWLLKSVEQPKKDTDNFISLNFKSSTKEIKKIKRK